MNAITAILEFGSNKHCFLERTASFQNHRGGNTPSPRDDGISVYELTGDNRKAYFSTRGGCSELVTGDTVQINGLYANKLGLQHEEPLILKRVKSPLSSARRVNVEPLSPDDWEILEKNSGRVETVLLDQIRVVWPDQVFPVWVQKSICVFMKITAVEPMSYCLLLELNTEVMVAPKTRLYNPPKSLGIQGMTNRTVPPFAGMAGHTKSPPPIQKRSPTPSQQSATPTKAKCWFPEEDKSSSRENLDTLEPRSVPRSPSRSPRNTLKRSMNKPRGSYSDPFSERQPKPPKPFLRRESSLMESVMKLVKNMTNKDSRYVFSFMERNADFDNQSESDTSSGIDFSSQNLPSRSGVLRVQPMKLSSSIEEVFHSNFLNTNRKWPSSSSLASSSSFKSVIINKATPNLPYELFQPSTVYVDANGTQVERELHPYLPRLPNNFIARLQRLPSPQEKAEAAQKGGKKTTKDGGDGQDKAAASTTSSTVNPSTNKTSDDAKNKSTSIRPSSGSSGNNNSSSCQETDCNINASCFVRVVVIDRKAGLTDEAWKDAADALLSQQPLMNGHVIVPDLLRRQLRLDTTCSVWLQTGTIDIVIPKKIVVHQLASLSFRITNEMLEKAFKAYIRLCADSEHPLILFQGLFIKYPVFPDLTVEVQLTFFGENDLANQKAVSMLSDQNIDSVMVCVERNAKVDKMAVVNSTLVYSKASDFDTQPPTVKLKHLGGTEKVAKTGLAFLQACVGSRPLSQETFRPRRGLCNGSLLITGPRGSGKSSLAKALCRKMSQIPTMAHIKLVDCKALRGKTVTHIQKILESVFDEAAWREPSVIVFDNLDVIVPASAGPEGEMNAEALYAAKNSQVLQGLIKYEMENNSRLAVIATAASKNSLHPTLVSYSGVHYFQVTLNIGSPNKEVREKILTCILQQHSSVSNETLQTVDLRPLATTTEGYVARDLEVLVNRAVHNRLIHDRDAHTSKITLTQEDFEVAQENFKPVSIRGVALHKAGDLGWADIGGLEDVKKALVETLRWPAKYPRLFSSCPLRMRSGILLYGAPGTGKTLLAGVVAKECGLNFISIKGPELLSKYIGASEQAVRDLFTRAMSAKPCILFFDEFDSIAPKRGHDSTGVTDRVVNQFLTQLDGVEGLDGVYVLAATSRPDLLDSALLRPGRLDKSLQCPVPTEEERFAILEALTRKMCLSYDVELMDIASMCNFFTGADLKALLYNAQLKAIHENARMEQRMDETVLRIKGDDDHCPAIQQATQLYREDFQAKLTIAREKSLSEKNSPTKAANDANYVRKASGTSSESCTSSEVMAENKFASAMSKDAKDRLMAGLTSELMKLGVGGDEETGKKESEPSDFDLLTPDAANEVVEKIVGVERSKVMRAPIHSVGFDVDGFLPVSREDENDDDDGFDFKDGGLTPLSEHSKASSDRSSSWVPMTSSPIYQSNGNAVRGVEEEEGMEVASPIFHPDNFEGELKDGGGEGDGDGGERSVPTFTFHEAGDRGSEYGTIVSEADDEDDDLCEETVINKLSSGANVTKQKKAKEEGGKGLRGRNHSDPASTYPPPHGKRKRSYDRTHSQPGQTLDVTDGRARAAVSVEKPVTVFTSLSDGLATLSPEDEARYLAMVQEIRRRDERLFEIANHKRRTSLMVSKPSNVLVEVCQRHLVEAASETRPSVTVNERRKYHNIYHKFQASRTADFGGDKTEGPGEKRATLA